MQCLPHQQRSDNPSKDVWEKMCKRIIAGCAELFPGTTGPHRSLVSLPDSLALFLDGDASIPCARPFIGKEFAHVHGVSDGSLHVGLSEADAQTVIKAGWGERHLLAGKQAGKMNVPAGLVMVYGPRNEQEIETVVDILRASYKWARGDIPPLRNSA